MRRWVLFDLDGTLTDPKSGITRCIAHALQSLGHEAPPLDSLTWCIGPPLRGSFCELVGEDQADAALAKYRERFGSVGLYENSVYPGIPECLALLVDRGFRLALATSKPRVYAEKILTHFNLDHWFTAVRGSELDGTRSAKEDLIRWILDREKVKPEEAVMVGDRRHDVVGAGSCGLPAVGVLYGYGSRDELESAGARVLCREPGEIPPAVATLFGI